MVIFNSYFDITRGYPICWGLAFSTESSCLNIAQVNLGWVKMDELSWKARPVEPPGTKWDFSCSGFWSIPCVDCADLIISDQMASGFSYQKNLGFYQQIARIHAIWLVDGFFLFQSLFGMINYHWKKNVFKMVDLNRTAQYPGTEFLQNNNSAASFTNEFYLTLPVSQAVSCPWFVNDMQCNLSRVFTWSTHQQFDLHIFSNYTWWFSSSLNS